MHLFALKSSLPTHARRASSEQEWLQKVDAPFQWQDEERTWNNTRWWGDVSAQNCCDQSLINYVIIDLHTYMMCRCPLSSCWYYDILWFHPLPSTQSYNRTITPMRILWYFSQPSVCCYAVPVDLLIVVLMETLSTSVSWMATCRSLSIVAATGVFTSFDPQIHDDLVNPPNHWYHPLYFYSTIFPC